MLTARISQNSVATLGPNFTNASFATKKWIGKTGNPIVLMHTIEDCFEVVDKGKVKSAVVPIENRLQGTVRETLDALFAYDVHIVGEITLPIRHCLAILPGASRKHIRTVISHPQALRQCGKYLRKTFPEAKWITAESTAAAFEHVKETGEKQAAVIGPKPAVRHFGFKLLKQNIENDPNNTTTFIVICKKSAKTRTLKHPKTSIVFYFRKDKQGSLLHVFQAFGDARINLTKIESRPAPKKLGEYLFFIDFEGDSGDKHVKTVLRKMGEIVAGMKVLGTY